MRTSKDYTADYRTYGVITVPAGVRLTHKTASGNDDDYHFVDEFEWIDTSYPDISDILKHDITHFGLDVPKEYVCYDKAWENFKRDDLNIIPYAADHGWTPSFNHSDRTWNRITPDNVPHNDVTFNKNNKRLWCYVKRTDEGFFVKWRVAEIVGIAYTNHRDYDSIKDAIDKEA